MTKETPAIAGTLQELASMTTSEEQAAIAVLNGVAGFVGVEFRKKGSCSTSLGWLDRLVWKQKKHKKD